jgi:hypothetical protein
VEIMSTRETRMRFILATVVAVAVGVLLAILPVSAQAASNGDLCLYGSDETSDAGVQMQAGTSPAVAEVSDGTAEVAFQDSTGQLATYLDASNYEATTDYGVAAGTSPAISANGSNVVVAMTAAGNNELWTGDGATMSGTGQLINAGTSPAVTALSATADEYLYNGTGGLESGDGSTWKAQQFGPEAGTSPALADVGGTWEGADQDNTSALWVHGDEVGYNSEDGMDTASSPTIAALGTSGDFEVAFEANTNVLWLVAGQINTPISGASTGESMAPGTNPSVTAIGSSTGFEIAYQGADGDLWLYGSDGSMDTGHAMATGTSPSIAQTAAGYEVAYQCAAPAPAPPPVTTTVVETTTVRATTPLPTRSKTRRVEAQFGLDLTWNGQTTHLVRISSLKRLPRTALIRFTCRARLKGYVCPRLGTLPTRRRTLAKELAVVANRIFAKDNQLTLTVSARGYATEVFTIVLTGSRPTISRRWT